ncbi:hypothetical protein RJT34_21822 [Clitoria ternatea]|uniref:Uncharacterized protein n=1 Tax=Clitoria ternatea TaxID=43366 RepID=A0AAN9IUZ9_CLITE
MMASARVLNGGVASTKEPPNEVGVWPIQVRSCSDMPVARTCETLVAVSSNHYTNMDDADVMKESKNDEENIINVGVDPRKLVSEPHKVLDKDV